jgi:hypothetical protein
MSQQEGRALPAKVVKDSVFTVAALKKMHRK